MDKGLNWLFMFIYRCINWLVRVLIDVIIIWLFMVILITVFIICLIKWKYDYDTELLGDILNGVFDKRLKFKQ